VSSLPDTHPATRNAQGARQLMEDPDLPIVTDIKLNTRSTKVEGLSGESKNCG